MNTDGWYFFKSYGQVSAEAARPGHGACICYFEIDSNMRVTRQIEVFANCLILHYDSRHTWDHYGGLPEQPFEATDSCQVVTRQRFEQAWTLHRPSNRNQSTTFSPALKQDQPGKPRFSGQLINA